MANYQQLKAAIDQVIKANGQKEITGPVLNDTLKAMVNSLGAGYQFRGVATPSTNPGTPDQNVFYIAGQGGTYTNFNSIVLPDGVSVLKWNGSWSSETVVAGDGVFDISAYKATGGTLATFADLSAALDGGNNIPQSLQKGGMSVKFIQGSAQSSDNKYVQYRLMSDSFNTNVSNWQGVDDVPTSDSDNLVKSGGAALIYGYYINNPEYLYVFTDKKKRKLFYFRKDGSVDWAKGIPGPIKKELQQLVTMIANKVNIVEGMSLINQSFAQSVSYIDNNEYLGVETDSLKRIVFAFKNTGQVYIPLPSNQDELIQQQVDKIVNDVDSNLLKKTITLSIVSKERDDATGTAAQKYAHLIDYISDYLDYNQYGLAYANYGQALIYKDFSGNVTVIDDNAVMQSYQYLYAGIEFYLFNARGYVMPQFIEKRNKPSQDVLDDARIPALSVMPNYSEDSWDWTKAYREGWTASQIYTIMPQVYEKMDELCRQYPNLITKYDPMATSDYTEDGITVHAMSNIKTYMNNHGFSAYPFWYDGCEEGDYDITVGSNTYHAHLKATPAFKTFVYKISQTDNWFMYKQDNRKVRRRIAYVQAGVHGYENMGPVAAYYLAKELLSTSESAFSVLANYDVYILPVLDGYNSWHGDYDGAYGTNANRNYPTPWWNTVTEHGGLAAGDYFVTRLACAFIDTLNPDVAFDVHDQTPAVKDLGYFDCGFHYTAHEMYRMYSNIASVIRNTPTFEQYFGTKNQIPLFRVYDNAMNAAHAHDYFFCKGIRCAGCLELPSGINYTAQPDGTSVYGRVTANDFNVNTWELASLITIDYFYGMCEYNINNF